MEEESRREKIIKSGMGSVPTRYPEGGFVLERKIPSKPSPPPPTKKPSPILFLSWSISLAILGTGLQLSYMTLILLGSTTTVITTGILLLFFRPYLIERSRNNFFLGINIRINGAHRIYDFCSLWAQCFSKNNSNYWCYRWVLVQSNLIDGT